MPHSRDDGNLDLAGKRSVTRPESPHARRTPTAPLQRARRSTAHAHARDANVTYRRIDIDAHVLDTHPRERPNERSPVHIVDHGTDVSEAGTSPAAGAER